MSFRNNGFLQPNMIRNIAQSVINSSNTRDARRHNNAASDARRMSDQYQDQASISAKKYIYSTLETLKRAATQLHDAYVDSPYGVGELMVEQLHPKAKQGNPFLYAQNRLILSFPGTNCTENDPVPQKREAMISAYSYQMWCLMYLFDRTAIANVCHHLSILHARNELQPEELEGYTTSIGMRVNNFDNPQACMKMFSERLRDNLTYQSETAITPELSSFPDYMARSAISRRFLMDFGKDNKPITIADANSFYTSFHPLRQQLIPLTKSYVAILNSAPAQTQTSTQSSALKTP